MSMPQPQLLELGSKNGGCSSRAKVGDDVLLSSASSAKLQVWHFLKDPFCSGGEGTILHCYCGTRKAKVLGQHSSTYLLLARVGKTFQATKIASDKLP